MCMLRERPCRECQGNIKKGLLLSDCGEQKAVLAAAAWGKLYLFIPGDSWFLRPTCATSPHPHQNNDASAKPMQSVSPFHSSCYRLPGKTHEFWPSRRFMTKLLAIPSPSFYSHIPVTPAFSYAYICVLF